MRFHAKTELLMIEIGLIFLAIFLVFILAGLAKDTEPGKASFREEHKKQGYKHLKNSSELKERYRRQLCRYFESQGYLIEYGEEKKSTRPKGIDIIATKFNETIMVKCENQKEKDPYRIDKNALKRFMVECDYCAKSFPEYRNERIRKVLITPENILDPTAQKFSEEYSKNIEYLLIPFENKPKSPIQG